MVVDFSMRKTDLLKFGTAILFSVFSVFLSEFIPIRIDLTEDKRFSLSNSTLKLIEKVEDPMLFSIYLEGDFPAGFQRLKFETIRMLEEFRAKNPDIEYALINPSENPNSQARRDTYTQLRNAGLSAIQIKVEESDGIREQQIFPGAIVSFRDNEWPISLLLEQFASNSDAQINASIQNLEYTLASAIKGLTKTHRSSIGILQGHDELSPVETASLELSLSKSYDIEHFNLREFPIDSINGEPDLNKQIILLNSFDLIILAKPRQRFSELDIWLIDQYLMNNGKGIWSLDAVYADMDSLSYSPEFLAYPILDRINLSDPLFNYGVRINTSLIQDMVCATLNDRKSIIPWLYFPLILPQTDHPIGKNLNAIKLEFATAMDSIRAIGVRKTPLLFTSPYSRRQSMPGRVSLATLYNEPDQSKFVDKSLITAILLEGALPSFYANRILQKTNFQSPPKKASNAKLLVISDGDFIKNQRNLVRSDIPRGSPLPLGYDQFTQRQYGNSDFILNAIDYMLDIDGLIEVRGREVALRLLDMQRINRQKKTLIGINILAPIALILIFGLLYRMVRKQRFSKFSR